MMIVVDSLLQFTPIFAAQDLPGCLPACLAECNDHYHAQPPFPPPLVYLSYSLTFLYHFHSISCLPFSFSSKLNYIYFPPSFIPIFFSSHIIHTSDISDFAPLPRAVYLSSCVFAVLVPIQSSLYSLSIESLLRSHSFVVTTVLLFVLSVAEFPLDIIFTLLRSKKVI